MLFESRLVDSRAQGCEKGMNCEETQVNFGGDYVGGYTTIYICQNSWNCNLKNDNLLDVNYNSLELTKTKEEIQ